MSYYTLEECIRHTAELIQQDRARLTPCQQRQFDDCVDKILDIQQDYQDFFAGAFFVVGDLMMPSEKIDA